MLYVQTTESQKYLTSVGQVAPSLLNQMVQGYKLARATYLGLDVQMQGPQGLQRLVKANLPLKAKLTALGSSFGVAMAAHMRLKTFIEAEVNAAITALGGFGAISTTSEWSFVLQDVTRDVNGVITGYALPGLPFLYTPPAAQGQPSVTYSVNITVADDGTGTATFTVVGGTGTGSSDPL